MGRANRAEGEGNLSKARVREGGRGQVGQGKAKEKCMGEGDMGSRAWEGCMGVGGRGAWASASHCW